MKLWLVREATAENTRRALETLAARFPEREIATISPEDSNDTLTGDVVVPWRGRPWSIGPVAHAVTWRRRGRRVQWLDDAGELGSCGLGFLLGEGTRLLLLRGCDLLLRGLARLLVARRAPQRIGGHGSATAGANVFVLPVLPDLSHTFLYREVTASIHQRPGCIVICLKHGANAPVHPEAEALLSKTEFVPRRGVLGRCADILGWMLRHPRRTGALLALYRRREHGHPADLLGKEPLRDPAHPGNAFALATLLKRRSIRQLHVYGSTYAANVVMGAAILLDLPFSISSYVDFDFPYDHRMLAAKYRLARFFRVCTRFCQRRLVETLALPDTSRLPVVYWGLDLGRWQDRAEPSERGVIVSASRIVAKKGLHLVPPALARLVVAGLSFRWVLIGDGPELLRIRELVSEHGIEAQVEFLGPQPNSTVREQLRGADLALLPCVVAADGERDGIPVFLTEAMAFGVPVLTTPVSGIPELVRDNDTGFLVPSNDIDALADRMIVILQDGELRRRVGENGHREVHATLDVERSAAELWQLIDAADTGRLSVP